MENRIISLTHLEDGKVLALCEDGTLWVTNNVSVVGCTKWMPVTLPPEQKRITELETQLDKITEDRDGLLAVLDERKEHIARLENVAEEM